MKSFLIPTLITLLTSAHAFATEYDFTKDLNGTGMMRYQQALGQLKQFLKPDGQYQGVDSFGNPCFVKGLGSADKFSLIVYDGTVIYNGDQGSGKGSISVDFRVEGHRIADNYSFQAPQNGNDGHLVLPLLNYDEGVSQFALIDVVGKNGIATSVTFASLSPLSSPPNVPLVITDADFDFQATCKNLVKSN